MKKIMFLLIAVMMMACTKPEPQSEVSVSIDYKFTAQSSNISSKGTSPDYDAFYTKYIVGRIFTPPAYDITFTDTNTKLSFNVKGEWSADKLFMLPIGTYTVNGVSMPTYSSSGDYCMLTFDETVTITPQSSKIILTAKYACSLLLFDNTNVSSVQMYYKIQPSYFPSVQPTAAYKSEKFFHVFVQSYVNGSYSEPVPYSLKITRNDGKSSILDYSKYSFSFGKYYYFADTESGYTLPPMESYGN